MQLVVPRVYLGTFMLLQCILTNFKVNRYRLIDIWMISVSWTRLISLGAITKKKQPETSNNFLLSFENCIKVDYLDYKLGYHGDTVITWRGYHNMKNALPAVICSRHTINIRTFRELNPWPILLVSWSTVKPNSVFSQKKDIIQLLESRRSKVQPRCTVNVKSVYVFFLSRLLTVYQSIVHSARTARV